MSKQGKSHVLSEDEFNKILIAAKDFRYPERNVAMIYCSFGLGLRAMEIAALKVSDVFDEKGVIRETVNLTRNMTKGQKQRFAYIVSETLQAALRNYIAIRKNSKRNGWLFLTQSGLKFDPDTLQKWFGRLYKKAGITGASSHSGRRTFITRLIEQGADIKAVSRLAGHSNINTTSEYIADNPERLKRISAMAIF